MQNFCNKFLQIGTGYFTILSGFKNFINQKVNKIKQQIENSSIKNTLTFWNIHQEVNKQQGFIVIHVFNVLNFLT